MIDLEHLNEIFGETITEEDYEENPWLEQYITKNKCEHEPVPLFLGHKGFCKKCDRSYILNRDGEIIWKK